MSLHRAVLLTRDYIEPDGTVVPIVKDEVPIGAEYIVDMSKRIPRQQVYNAIVRRWFEFEMVWITSPRHVNDPGGVLPAFLLDIDEGPLL